MKRFNNKSKGVINLIQVNFFAVVVASIAAMLVGFIWYSQILFGKQWMKLSGNNMQGPGMVKTFAAVFLATLISAYILSIFIHYAGAYSWLLGAKTGLWAFLGFVMPTTLANHLFSKKPLHLYLIQSGHHLIALMIMGAILASWF